MEQRDLETLESLGAAGDQLGLLLRDRVGTRVLHQADGGGPGGGDDRELVTLLGRADELPAVSPMPCGAAALNAPSLPRTQVEPRAGESQDAGAAGRRPSGRGSAPPGDAHLRRGGLGRRFPAQRPPSTLANRRGPGARRTSRGEVTAVLTSATIPPRTVERVGLQGSSSPKSSTSEARSTTGPMRFSTWPATCPTGARHRPKMRCTRSCLRLIGAAGGRTLALFTSRRATEAAAKALAPDVPGTVLLQGDLPKALLLREFAADEPSCLFATLGFWQGVDIPGRALSLVTIDRLPFPRPDDPLLQARRDRAGGAAFPVVDLPRAATLLAQGAGRLIRTADDRGVVAVLDPRLATASYRGVLLATLPPMRRSVDFEEVQSFLRAALRSPPG